MNALPWWAWTIAASCAGISFAAWILRWEARARLRAHRYGGFVIGGER